MHSRQREEYCTGLGMGDGVDEDQGYTDETMKSWAVVRDTITASIIHAINRIKWKDMHN